MPSRLPSSRPSWPSPEALAYQPAPRGDGRLTITIAYLELTSGDWTRRGQPPAQDVSVIEEPSPSVPFYRDLYDRVGRPWLWFERRLLVDRALADVLSQPGHEIHVARHEGDLVGYFELQDDEISFFGLTPGYIGERIGPWLLDRAIERSLARGSERVTLNTNSLDHPRALDTYRKAGFRILRRETKDVSDPRTLWPDLYRWQPG